MGKNVIVDHEGKEITRGFYRRIHSERIYYFGGEYDKSGFPVIEKDGVVIENYKTIEKTVRKLTRINEQGMNKSLARIRERIKWLEDCVMSDKVEALREEYDNLKKG